MKDLDTLFLAVMMGSRLCLRCASARSDIVEDVLVGLIRRVQRRVYVTESLDDCDACGRRTVVYRLR